MELHIDIFLKQEGATRLITTKLTDADIKQLIKDRIESEEIRLPIAFDKDKSEIQINIDKVIV